MGTTTRKTIVVPCIVKSWLYVSGSTTSAFACASCMRITSARAPPARKKARLVAMYRIPIRLWSVVVIQLVTRPSYHGTGYTGRVVSALAATGLLPLQVLDQRLHLLIRPVASDGGHAA